jgi:hypothetical protein
VRQHRMRPWTIHPKHRRTIVKTSISPTAQPVHPMSEIQGADRLLGRTRDDLQDALTWLAWYAQGTYTAVMDYLDHCNGDPIPGREPAAQ